jgi:hypothetical protein
MPYAGPSATAISSNTSLFDARPRQRKHVRSHSSESRVGLPSWSKSPHSLQLGYRPDSSDDDAEDSGDSLGSTHLPWTPSSAPESSTSFSLVRAVSGRGGGFSQTKPEMLPRALAPAVRKKSGELVKPSLKSLGRHRSQEVKSAPATPLSAPKYVHFDSHLEHIKLFLAQQRPAAVSRDGSPDEAETEEDGEYPFPRPLSPPSSKSGPISPVLANGPLRRPGSDADDCRLEGIELSPDNRSLYGTVLVRNICFEKRVVIRFTFDDWQTVSEIAAEWKESLREGKFDRWHFTVKLVDLLAHIEQRKMWFAIRFEASGVGREIWDNNIGKNYRVDFVKSRPRGRPEPRRETDSRAMAELRRELDRIAGAGDADIGRMTRRDTSIGGDKTPKAQAPTSSPFSSRYDFGASFRARRDPDAQPPPPYFAPSGPVVRSPPAEQESKLPSGPFGMGGIVGGMPATDVSLPVPARSHSAPSLYSLSQGAEMGGPSWGSYGMWPWPSQVSSEGDTSTSSTTPTSTADTSPSAATPSISPPMSPPLSLQPSAPTEDWLIGSKRPSMDSGFFSEFVQKVRVRLHLGLWVSILILSVYSIAGEELVQPTLSVSILGQQLLEAFPWTPTVCPLDLRLHSPPLPVNSTITTTTIILRLVRLRLPRRPGRFRPRRHHRRPRRSEVRIRMETVTVGEEQHQQQL